MKKLIYIFLLIIWMHPTAAQSIGWTKLFDIHSQNALGGLSKNTIKDSNNNLVTAVVESDVLKIYQLDSHGNNIATLNTNRECGYFAPIVKTDSDNYALLFDNTPNEINPTFKLLCFDANLDITQEIDLNFPDFDFFTFGTFFTKDGIFYFTTFSNTSHLIYYLNAANELTLKHISPINNAHRDKVHLLQNNAVIFEYDEGQNHQLRCISTETGQLIWDRHFINNNINSFQLNYKTIIGDNQKIYFAGLERTWVSGQAVDVFKLKSIDSSNGNTIRESTYTLAETGTASIDDIKFNPVNNHIYLSYLSSYPDEKDVVLEFDATLNLLHQARFDYVYDSLSSWVKSEIVIRENGDLIFIYTNYKNVSENGNLHVVGLASDLTINGSFELNIEPKNSSESFSHFLMYDDAKMLITGCIPNSNPSIGFEEVQYYLAMIDVDDLLSVGPPDFGSNKNYKPYPNPTQSLVFIKPSEVTTCVALSLYNNLGEKIKEVKNTNNIDLQNLESGTYFLKIQSKNGAHETHKIVRQ